MTIRSVFYILGLLLMGLSATMLLPLSLDYADGNIDWSVFLRCLIVTGFFGFLLYLTNRGGHFSLKLKEIFILTTLGWLVMAGFAALPFMLASSQLSFSHAFFESMSGLTGTGSTALVGLDSLPRGILMWRALLHFIGGIGFVAVAFLVLPLLQVSGMQIFRTDSPDLERVLPSGKETVVAIALIYTALTALCAAALAIAGMSGFDAVAHAMATMATGGFSTHDASIGFYDNNAGIKLVLSVFMIAAALPYVLYLRVLRGDSQPLFSDNQVTTFIGTIVSLIWVMTIYLLVSGIKTENHPLLDATFLVTSAISTTGFAIKNYVEWGHMIVGIIFMTAFFGGCSGSSAGGAKIFRIQILFRMIGLQIRKLIKPHGVFQLQYNGKTIDSSLQAAVSGFFFIYVMTWLALSIALEVSGHDFATAFSGALAALSNTSTGASNGMGNDIAFVDMSPASIWIYSMAMLLGRLEFLTVLALLAPAFWKK